MAAYSEITIEQYADFSTTINVEDLQGNYLNLFNYSVASQIRKSFYSSVATDFVAAIGKYDEGEILLDLSANTTANLSPGRYLYDVVIKSGTNEVTRVVEGIVNVIPGVTRNV